jgi:hypothetical protein
MICAIARQPLDDITPVTAIKNAPLNLPPVHFHIPEKFLPNLVFALVPFQSVFTKCEVMEIAQADQGK